MATSKEDIVEDEPSSRPGGRQVLLIVILLLLIVTMAGIVGVDYSWTLGLNANKVAALADFMSRTLFEGEGFGGGDPAILYLVFVLFAYLSAWGVIPLRRFGPWRPQLGFIVATAPVVGLFIVHSLKWVVGRARPREVVRQGMAYTDWYETGPHYITEGIYRGSFPSGHTASVLVLLTAAYLLAGDRHNSGATRLGGWLWGLIVLLYCLTMALSRSMTFSHWIGDSLFTMLAGCLIMHCMYYWVLRIPQQTGFFRQRGYHPELPKLWELQLVGNLFLITCGLTAIGLGLRAFREQPVPWLAGLIVPGIVLVFYFGRRCRGLLDSVRDSMRWNQISNIEP